ncbi:MAG: hypothetical protein U0Q16_07835 [Bryobacteraceae bacterium]
MTRRELLSLGAGSALWGALPPTNAIAEPHFPSRLYQFVWRNWELVGVTRMAALLRTSAANIIALGRQMGLANVPEPPDLKRIYVTVIRQNWHLLPEEQLIDLLGWDRAKYDFTLKEDDFLDHKLGNAKPRCEALVYRAPSAEERTRAAEIAAMVRLAAPASQPAMHFIQELSSTAYPRRRSADARVRSGEVDLSAGWKVEGSTDAMKRLERYLREAMGASRTGGKPIRARISTDGTSEGWRIRVAADSIEIEAHDPAGIAQAVYELQDRMDEREGPFLRIGVTERRAVWNPRYLYSYFALYGDPLLEPEADPFPDGYLEKLARGGINGVWMQAVLNSMAPSPTFPEFGAGSEIRLRNLKALVERASRFGVKIYLYLNEPRSMSAEFFAKREAMRGTPYRELFAMCTSAPEVRQWITASLAHVFGAVPELGGVFTISMSENHTNCFSHGGAWRKEVPTAEGCPRCSRRPSYEVLAELFQAMHDGIRQGSKTAELIHYDWGWPDDMADKLIPLLAKDSRIVSISEWSQPVERGGVKTKVGEYSMSVPGPGPRATRNWKVAREAGVGSLAKVQLNNTWEISAVPFIPVPQLVLEHLEGLRKAGISGLMPSWTCGGYASPNLEAAAMMYGDPLPPRGEILERVARRRYGSAAAADAIQAWSTFSEAFREFPYGVHVYILPTQHGPANLLRLQPTGASPGMILFPHDAYKAWCGAYPPEVAQKQLQALAGKWSAGLPRFRQAAKLASPVKRENARTDLMIAEACQIHFQSAANQIEFYRMRDAGNKARMVELAEAEIELAQRLYPIARAVSTIGYEASNHYYYRPLDLAEKVINCRQVIAELRR